MFKTDRLDLRGLAGVADVKREKGEGGGGGVKREGALGREGKERLQ